jgi:hypothetical protein
MANYELQHRWTLPVLLSQSHALALKMWLISRSPRAYATLRKFGDYYLIVSNDVHRLKSMEEIFIQQELLEPSSSMYGNLVKEEDIPTLNERDMSILR